MKVSIKDLMNGWLVRYQVFDNDDRLRGEKEKAFTYILDDEKKEEDAWRRVEWFVAGKLLDWGLHKKIYLQIYDEEKEEWVGRQEFKKRNQKKEDYFEKDKWKNNKWVERGSGKVTKWTKQDYKIFKKWEQERIADMTLEERELICANLTFDNLLKHFKNLNHDCMTLEEYEEIRSISEEQCTKVFGSKP